VFTGINCQFHKGGRDVLFRRECNRRTRCDGEHLADGRAGRLAGSAET